MLVALLIFFHYRNLLPKFILPSKKLSLSRYRIKVVAMRIVMISVVILPLHIGFVADKRVNIHKATPVQIILDVSLSMAATDISPSRFSIAKSYLMDAVKHMQGYDISLIAFSGIPFVVIPFSHDTNAILQSMEGMSLADFPAAPQFL